MIEDCEGVAAEVLEAGRFCGSPNPWEIVDRLGIGVRYGVPGVRPHVEPDAESRSGWRIVLDPSERPEQQAMTLMHESGHLLNRAHGIELAWTPHRLAEQAAWWTGLAMMFPRHDFLARRRRHGWAIDQLRAYYPRASHEATARRLVMIERTAILWVWDAEGPRQRKYPVLSPGLRWARRSPTKIEHEAMELARVERTAVEPMGGVRAWAVSDPPWLRILCLSDAEVLGAV